MPGNERQREELNPNPWNQNGPKVAALCPSRLLCPECNGNGVMGRTPVLTIPEESVHRMEGFVSAS